MVVIVVRDAARRSYKNVVSLTMCHAENILFYFFFEGDVGETKSKVFLFFFFGQKLNRKKCHKYKIYRQNRKPYPQRKRMVQKKKNNVNNFL